MMSGACEAPENCRQIVDVGEAVADKQYSARSCNGLIPALARRLPTVCFHGDDNRPEHCDADNRGPEKAHSTRAPTSHYSKDILFTFSRFPNAVRNPLKLRLVGETTRCANYVLI
jgi:hypothetical protein